MKQDSPHILLVNPWIYDFAAYDFWAKPLGILTLAAILRHHGLSVTYMDCLDRFHPNATTADPYARHGRGPYLKTLVSKPACLEDIPRNYCRYGVLPEWFKADLLNSPRPDLVLVTSLMTYWYPGVQEVICIIRETFPEIPIVLGGIYATLCRDHAVKHSGADRVVAGPAEASILSLIEEFTGFSITPEFSSDKLDSYPYPAFDLQRVINYVPLLTSRGCPFSCAYCASRVLSPKRMRRSPEAVVEEIIFWHKKFGVNDFVFYDDALLADADVHAIPIFEAVIRAGLSIRFHTPNALHIRKITKEIADLMYKTGFKTLRLGLETAAFGARKGMDDKVTEKEFIRAISYLKVAGFERQQIGAYLLAGMPGQPLEAVAGSVRLVKKSGITPVPAYYTPIPQTDMWPQAVESSRYDLESDPIFTNNAILPCQKEPFSWDSLSALKNLVKTAS